MYSQLIGCEGEQAGGRADGWAALRLEGVSVHALYVRTYVCLNRAMNAEAGWGRGRV